MDKIKAKAISNSFWILQKNNKKVGQLSRNQQGYNVNINGSTGKFKNKSDLDMIEFIEIPKPQATESSNVHGYPTNGIAYNALWNLKYKLPLFTITADSKSWHAAGYYNILLKNKHVVEFCPKLITLQRNRYSGPYNSKPEPMFNQLFK